MQITLQSKRFANSVYQKTGHGLPLIFIHGFGEDSSIWKHQIDDLQNNFTVLVPDLPGSGDSPLPKEEMSIELLADFIVEMLVQEKIEKTILIGHSMGGYIVLAIAEKYPELLTGFSLVHSSAYEDDETKKENRRKSIKLIANDGKEIFLKTMIPNLYSAYSQKNKTEEMAEHLTIAMKLSSKALQAYYNAMINRPSRIHVLQNTNIPVHFVIGTEDNAIPYEQSLTQCSMPQISKVDILQNTGHTSMFENPAKLNAILHAFCNYVSTVHSFT